MTKLMEWLCGSLLYLGTWLFLTKFINFNVSDHWVNVLHYLPIYTALLFGVYYHIVVLWRVYNFNDCPEAAKELQLQIKAAKEDLKSKGLKI